ncbi:MAG: DUF3267 domain-containing protein [Lachnospiraceae bacterium]|nr:DUF3267 domain-containing protein [Lachnospiraceae bacterium]
MPHIKWLGIIKDDLGRYQKGNLPDGAIKVDMPDDMNVLMVKSIPFQVIGIVIITVSVYIKVMLNEQFPFELFFTVIGFALGFLALILHEILHAIVFPKEATVYVGIYPKCFAAVALSAYPLRRSRFIAMSLLPMILGVIPITLFLVLPDEMKTINGLMLGMSMIGLTSPSVDLYNVYKVLMETPKGSTLQFNGDELYFYK